jgi:hypothetical protein
MVEKRENRDDGCTSAGELALKKWYQSHHAGDPSEADWHLESIDGDCLWLALNLRPTDIHGWALEPFVLDLSGGCWLQGWSDGDVLTLCTPADQLELAVGYLRVLSAGAGRRAETPR